MNKHWTLFLALVTSACSACASSRPATKAQPASSAPAGTSAKLEWLAAMGSEGDMVAVTLKVDGHEVQVGELDGASDDGLPALQTCTVVKAQATLTEFTCGSTPRYNAFEARLEGGQLVISSIERLDNPDGAANDTRKELKRLPLAAAALDTFNPPPPPAG